MAERHGSAVMSLASAGVRKSLFRVVGRTEGSEMHQFLDIVFDGPPDYNAGRFVELEDANGRSLHAGEWLLRPDGYWVLRLTPSSFEDEAKC